MGLLGSMAAAQPQLRCQEDMGSPTLSPASCLGPPHPSGRPLSSGSEANRDSPGVGRDPRLRATAPELTPTSRLWGLGCVPSSESPLWSVGTPLPHQGWGLDERPWVPSRTEVGAQRRHLDVPGGEGLACPESLDGAPPVRKPLPGKMKPRFGGHNFTLRQESALRPDEKQEVYLSKQL